VALNNISLAISQTLLRNFQLKRKLPLLRKDEKLDASFHFFQEKLENYLSPKIFHPAIHAVNIW
jgi:hypothetical protein